MLKQKKYLSRWENWSLTKVPFKILLLLLNFCRVLFEKRIKIKDLI